jgi:hypothetical protein
MTFILSKKSKPKLVENNILNQLSKQNLLKKQMNIVNSEKTKYKLLLNTAHDKCIDFLTNYFWIILIIIVIIYILWCRYKWYQESLKKKNFTYFDDDYTLQYNKNDNYEQNKYYLNKKNDNYQQNKYYLNKKNDNYQQNNETNQSDCQNINTQYTNKKNDNYQQNNETNQSDYQNINTQYTNKKNDNCQQNNETNQSDYQNINTQYTNKKDIKYNKTDNNIKAINFDTINNTFYDPISNNNSNYSFL